MQLREGEREIGREDEKDGMSGLVEERGKNRVIQINKRNIMLAASHKQNFVAVTIFFKLSCTNYYTRLGILE